jgi:ureidoacrylate peracid hydrolase
MQNAEFSPGRVARAREKGSWDAGVIAEVGPVGDGIVIPQTASGVFNATSIDYVLRNLAVEHLVIYGIMTDQCVESAIRDAAQQRDAG